MEPFAREKNVLKFTVLDGAEEIRKAVAEMEEQFEGLLPNDANPGSGQIF